MFDIQVQLLVARRPVTLEGFVDSILAELCGELEPKCKTCRKLGPVSAEIPLPKAGRKSQRDSSPCGERG